jgi:hypothetical protein
MSVLIAGTLWMSLVACLLCFRAQPGRPKRTSNGRRVEPAMALLIVVLEPGSLMQVRCGRPGRGLS